MRIYPVLDLTGGHVVHAVAGQRESYRTIASRLTHSSSPGDVARAIVEIIGNPKLAQEWGKRGNQKVMNAYTWESVYERFSHASGIS